MGLVVGEWCGGRRCARAVALKSRLVERVARTPCRRRMRRDTRTSFGPSSRVRAVLLSRLKLLIAMPTTTPYEPPSRSDIAAYVVATNVSTTVAMVTGLVVRNLVGAEVYGAYFLALSIAGYLALVNTPINTMIDIEVPLMLGREGDARLKPILGRAYGLLSWMTVAQAAAIGAAGLIIAGGSSAAAFVAVALAFPFEAMSQIDRLLLKGFALFRRLLVLSIGVAAVQVMLYIGFTAQFGAAGFFIAVVLVASVRFGTQRRVAAREVPFKWIRRGPLVALTPHLKRSGGAITLYKVCTLGMESIDRLFIARYMSLGALGVYSVSVAIAGVVRPVSRSIAGGVLPQYLRLRGGGGNDEAVMRLTLQMNRAVLWITCALVLVAMVALDVLVAVFLPGFEEAVVPGQILLVAEVVQQARLAPLGYVLGSPNRRPLVVGSAVGLLVAAGGAALAAQTMRLSVVAGASLVAYAASYGLILLRSRLIRRGRLAARTIASCGITSVPIALHALTNRVVVVMYTAVAVAGCIVSFLRAAGLSWSVLAAYARKVRRIEK